MEEEDEEGKGKEKEEEETALYLLTSNHLCRLVWVCSSIKPH